MSNLSYTQLKRLQSIDFRLYFYGFFSRKDIAEEFDVREEAISRDIALYQERYSYNLTYDSSKRRYVITDKFAPAYTYNSNEVLSYMSKRFDGFSYSQEYGISIYKLKLNSFLNTEILSKITQAISQKRVLKINYYSRASGKSLREIVPFSITNIGTKYYLRAYCRKRGKFISFVIARIQQPELILDSKILEHEQHVRDTQWNNFVTLKLSPHPKLSNPEFVKLDYNIEDKRLEVKVRSAFAGYFLRMWNVDCSKGNRLDENIYHLYLENNSVLDDVESAFIAPR